jgi:hypothetical protein
MMRQLAYRWWCAPSVDPGLNQFFAKSGGSVAFWHHIGICQNARIFLWQQDIGGCATLANGSSLACVRSGGQFLDTPRDQLPPGGGKLNLGDGDRGQICAGSGLNLDKCRSFTPTSSFGALVGRTARRFGVEPRALAVRGLLHLPRVASYEGWMTIREIELELKISADRLRRDVRAAKVHVPHQEFALGDLAFEEIDSSRALPVLTLLHYLRSARPGSLYFALVDPIHRLPVTLCSLSLLQWKCVGSQIRSHFAIPPQRIWDVSRVYSVDTAPRNAISMLLSRVRTYMRHNMSSADLLLTVVDPNLGFTGCSYRAANWQQWVTIKARPYFYESGRYVSPRQLREQYGTANLKELQAKYPGRFQQSRVRLLDSMIYCCTVNGETKVVLAHDRRRLHR